MMPNDDNDSIQQSLPLSWEDSEPEPQEQAAPKKLLLRREEPVEPEPSEAEELYDDERETTALSEDDDDDERETTALSEDADDDERETTALSEDDDDDIPEDHEEPQAEQIRVQKPLLLKKVEEQAARLSEDHKATVIDERFYGKPQIDVEDFSDYEDDAHLDPFEDDAGPKEESSELSEDLEDEQDIAENDEQESESNELSKDLEDEQDIAESESSELSEDLEDEQDITENDEQESENELSEDLEDEQDNADNNDLSEDIGEGESEDKYLGLEKENSLDDESEKENKEASAFADTGTFTLDDDYEESEEDFPEEDESRLSIPEDVLEDFEEEELGEELEDSSESDTSEEKSLSEKIEAQQEEMTAEESVFALKADTYYDHTDIESTKDESSLDSPPIETPEDAEVFQHEDRQSLGELLQEARLACSFTIKDASEATRIKSSYIISLESNEFHELPAKVYILNYIRQLCREYNIAHEPVINQYEKQADDNNNGEVKVVRVGDEDARRATKPQSKLNTLVVGSSLLVFGILLFTAWTMQWFGPSNSADAVKDVEINLIEVRSGVKLPSPELPVPTR